MSAPVRPQPKTGILDIAAYVPGRESVPGVEKIWKLSSNETPLGPSPKVAETLMEVSQKMALYPDGGSTKLRRAIAEVHGLNEGNIICGNGSDELLNLLTQTYIQPGDEAIYTEHGFLVYQVYIRAAGGTPVVAKESNERTDADAILAAVTDKTRMVFLANPNNPTGTYMPVEEVRRLHAGLRKDILLVLDAAYSEYVRRNDYEAGIELVSSSDNVVMTRTFSKIYGLASLRIGWMYAPANVVDAINRIRSPFNVNAMAIEAGAAAIRDRAHVDEAVAFNALWNTWLTQELTALGLRVTPSVGNFLLVHFPETEGKTAPEADQFLCSRGYILRAVKAYGFPNALRLTIGAEEANRGVVNTLAEFLKR